MINYSLKDNAVTTDPNDLYAQVEITETVDVDGVVQQMLDRNSTLGIEDVQAMLAGFAAIAETNTKAGRSTNFGFVIVRPYVRGVFHGRDDVWDPQRHKAGADAVVTSDFGARISAAAKVNRVESDVPTPDPLDYEDALESVKNVGYTIGGAGILRGARLSFNPEADDEGIYFIAVNGGLETKVSTVFVNKPGTLMFMVPEGLGGDQWIEVRARMKNSAQLRPGKLLHILSEI